MRSKNSKAIRTAEREHLARVKECACAVCDAPGPSEAHHIRQGDHFTCVSLCIECHRGPMGIHGDRTLWRIYKVPDEVAALNRTLEMIANG